MEKIPISYLSNYTVGIIHFWDFNRGSGFIIPLDVIASEFETAKDLEQYLIEKMAEQRTEEIASSSEYSPFASWKNVQWKRDSKGNKGNVRLFKGQKVLLTYEQQEGQHKNGKPRYKAWHVVPADYIEFNGKNESDSNSGIQESRANCPRNL
ncbi:MAG: hypothetical protein ABIH72_05010 [archaeon]